MSLEAWFIWDPLYSLIGYIISIIFYLFVAYHPEIKLQWRKNAYLVGLIICFLNWFIVGLYFITNILLYVSTIYAFNHFKKKWELFRSHKVR